jgi:GntR family transcriptional regulator
MDTRRADFEAHRRQSWTQQTTARRAHSIMRAAIRSRIIGPEQPLVEAKLVEGLAMSRNAVRSALRRLAVEGLVVRRTRSGTAVAPGSIMRLPAAEPWPANRRDVSAPPVARELERRVVPATELLSSRLGVALGSPVLMVEHLIEAERPLAVRVGYRRLPDDEVVPLPRDPELRLLPGPPLSLDVTFDYLQGRDLGRLDGTVEAIAADPRTSQLLGIPADAPILLRETLAHRPDGTPFEVAFSWHPGDRVAVSYSTHAL